MRSRPSARAGLALRRSIVSLACGAILCACGSPGQASAILDAGGGVKAIHSGFSGPATGEAHRHLRERFEDLILEMLAEYEAGGAEAPAAES